MALAHRVQKLEGTFRPARQIFVVPICYDCGRALDEAAEATAHAQSRARDIVINSVRYADCPRCEKERA
jgi:hypothetical protein